MSNDIKLSSEWNSIFNLIIEFKSIPFERKEIFINIVKEFIELCEQNKVKMTQKKAVKMMKVFLEIKEDNRTLLKFKNIIDKITKENEFNHKKWKNIINLSIEFKSKSKRNIFQKLIETFLALCHKKNIMITQQDSIRMMKAFLEISDNNDDELEFAKLFYILIQDDINNKKKNHVNQTIKR